MELIRTLACHSLLVEAFHFLASRGTTLQRELQNERQGHADRLLDQATQLRDDVAALGRAKATFLRDEPDHTEANEQLALLDTLRHELQTQVIAPLQLAYQAQSNGRQDEARAMVEALIVKAPYGPIIRRAQSGRATARQLQDSAVRACRDFGTPLPLPPRVRVFFGCAAERISEANALKQCLEGPDIEVDVWDRSRLFRLGGSVIEGLEAAVAQCHFGVFFYTPDDQLTSRTTTLPVPRINVILELGMFIGRHTRYRALIVRPRDVHHISDLAGVIVAEYDPSMPPAQIAKVLAERIREAIEDARRSA